MHDNRSVGGFDPKGASPGDRLSTTGQDERLAALAHLLDRPLRVTLTDEQIALSLTMVRDLCAAVTGALTRASGAPPLLPPAGLWDMLLDSGFVAAPALAPALLARIEEHRWRQASARGALTPSAPRDRLLVVSHESGLDERADETAASIDESYLALRIADGARHDAGQGPLLPLAELPAAAHAALVDDVVAAWLALGTDDGAGDRLLDVMAAVRANSDLADIDRTARAYVLALDGAGCTVDALASALARHDWCAVMAIMGVRANIDYAATAQMLLIGSPKELDVLCSRARIDDGSKAALVAALPKRAAVDFDAYLRRRIRMRAAMLRARREG